MHVLSMTFWGHGVLEKTKNGIPFWGVCTFRSRFVLGRAGNVSTPNSSMSKVAEVAVVWTVWVSVRKGSGYCC